MPRSEIRRLGMIVNGKFKILDGMSFTEIGKLLKEASENKDGLGLTVFLLRGFILNKKPPKDPLFR